MHNTEPLCVAGGIVEKRVVCLRQRLNQQPTCAHVPRHFENMVVILLSVVDLMPTVAVDLHDARRYDMSSSAEDCIYDARKECEPRMVVAVGDVTRLYPKVAAPHWSAHERSSPARLGWRPQRRGSRQ